MTQKIHAHLFEYGGGIVVGTSDVAVARAVMSAAIRLEWEANSPFPWQMYDFTHREPVIQLGKIGPAWGERGWMNWHPCAPGEPGSIIAVVWSG